MNDEQLRKDFEQHESSDREKFKKLFECQQANTDAITKLATSVNALTEDTKSVIQLHKDFQGAARLGKGIQGFMLWLLKWGTIGAGVVAMITWLVEHFSKAS